MTILLLASVTIVCLILTWLVVPFLLAHRRRKKTIAIFHIYCSSGGGGERVLWHLVKVLLEKYVHYKIYIFTKHTINDKRKLFAEVLDKFNIDLTSTDRVALVPLEYSSLTEAKRYPFLTLLLQVLGSIIVGIEAAYKLAPEVYFETIGFSFTLPIFKIHQCKIVTYVHYPTISEDMIRNVRTNNHASFNNREIFVKSSALRLIKLFYYRLLAFFYGLSGRQADLVMVNSSWTKNHIASLWQTKPHVVYPPCDVKSFRSLGLDRFEHRDNAINIVSIAQFRPEKNHQLQIEAFNAFLSKSGAYNSTLTLYGTCRDQEDRARVGALKELIKRLKLQSNVFLVVGASFQRLLAGLQNADVAIHTMENEHFGIVLLECMAAGLIMVAHNSGGPRHDIVKDSVNGFLAEDIDSFSDKLTIINNMSHASRQELRGKAIKQSEKFSITVFEESFLRLCEDIFGHN